MEARVLYDRPVAASAPRPAPEREKAIIVCPTGWTADEDIPLLAKALRIVDRREGPGLEVYLTGDGPLRAAAGEWLAPESFRRVRVHTGYWPEGEYRELIREADLGISLHRSSSGADLAMKVVDLFAARVPVCALDYGGSLAEQVEHGRTGLLFRTAEELAAAVSSLVGDRARRDGMRRNIEERWGETWDQAWTRAAAPLFESRP